MDTYKNQSDVISSNNFRKSCSSINVSYMGNGKILRESHSFTDGVQENYRLHGHQDHEEDGHSDKDSPKENAIFYIWTKQINSFEPFMVYEDMLTFQGKRYSQSEIAPIWKKDCRMWLWKTRQPRITKKDYRRDVFNIMKKFSKLAVRNKGKTKFQKAKREIEVFKKCLRSGLYSLEQEFSVILGKFSKLKLM